MSSLQIALVALAGLVVLAVWVYNRWLIWRMRPRRSVAPQKSVADVTEGGDAQAGLPSWDQRQEPMLEGASPELYAPEMLAPDRRADSAGVLDPMLDVIVALSIEGSVASGDALLAALPATRRVGNKSLMVEGFNAEAQCWETPQAGQRYRKLRAGVQLANRHGPLNEIEYSEFVVKVQALADAIGAAADVPDMLEEVARARELDHFASAHDAQLSLTLRSSRTLWSPGYLHRHVAACGFVAGALPGRMVLPSAQPAAPPVLVLQYETQLALAEHQEQVALHEFRLILDVPHVAQSERPFERLCETALHLAQAMEGEVTDGSQPLSRDELEQIGADLQDLYLTLDDHGLPAGAPLTRRLFS